MSQIKDVWPEMFLSSGRRLYKAEIQLQTYKKDFSTYRSSKNSADSPQNAVSVLQDMQTFFLLRKVQFKERVKWARSILEDLNFN